MRKTILLVGLTLWTASTACDALEFTLQNLVPGQTTPMVGDVHVSLLDSDDAVKLVVKTEGFTSTEFLSELKLNLAPDVMASILQKGTVTKQVWVAGKGNKPGHWNTVTTSTVGSLSYTSTFALKGFSYGEDLSGNQAGAGLFDLGFDAPTASANRLPNGTEVTFTLFAYDYVGKPINLDPENFDFFSSDASNGPWQALAHIQGLPGNGSTWIREDTKVPDAASTLALLGFGLVGVGALRRGISGN